MTDFIVYELAQYLSINGFRLLIFRHSTPIPSGTSFSNAPLSDDSPGLYQVRVNCE